MIMLPKTHISFVAFAILAVKIARASADAYDRSESEGYSTPYIPSQDGSEQDTPTDGADIPSSTSSSFQEEPTNEGYQPEELNTVPSSTRTSSRPSNTPNGNRNENGNGKRYTPVTETLSDGSSYQKGSFNSSLKWQSTGVLKHGGCPVDAMIGDCYSMYLDSDGMLEPMEDKSSPRKSKRHHPRQLIPPPQDDEDPYHHSLGVDSPHHYFKQLAATIGTGGPIDDPTTADMNNWKVMASSGKPPCKAQGGAKDNEPPAPRQRLEFLSWPPAPARETWDYAWRTYIDDRTTTTSKWWHMMQLLQRSGCGGYATALTASKKSVVIKDKNRECPNGICDSYDYSMYKGRTLSHHIRVRYGEDGMFGYKVIDLTDGKTILEYNVIGDMGSSSSVKFGIYRQAVEGMSEARAYVGDYVAQKVVV